MESVRSPQQIGEYLHYTTCRGCLYDGIIPVLQLGNVPLAGGFFPKNSTEKDFSQERLYPLELSFCPRCSLLQVSNVVPADTLFKRYYYFSSAIGTLVTHFQQYATNLASMFPDPRKKLIVELGCNDGVFLKPLMREGFKVVGVDPATNVVKPLIAQGFRIYNDYFSEHIADQIRKRYGAADIIVSSNSFAHIDDMQEVLRGIKKLLRPSGFLAIEVQYLPAVLNGMQYDLMYHEHQSYYSLHSLRQLFLRYDLEIFDALMTDIHASVIRVYVQRRGAKRPIKKIVRELLAKEKSSGLLELKTYTEFSARVESTKRDLLKLLKKLKKQHKTIVGYGASGRATAVLSYCGIGKDELLSVVDDAPAKIGAYMPGSHIQIRSSAILSDRKQRPDFCVLFAWPFAKEILKRQQKFIQFGGKFIQPLPAVKFISEKT